jgi:hypothetical protein
MRQGKAGYDGRGVDSSNVIDSIKICTMVYMMNRMAR